jgi:hypothetical protein
MLGPSYIPTNGTDDAMLVPLAPAGGAWDMSWSGLGCTHIMRDQSSVRSSRRG